MRASPDSAAEEIPSAPPMTACNRAYELRSGHLGIRRLWILLFIAVAFAAAGCREVVLHDVDESRANSLLMLFARHGIDGSKERSGTLWNVGVPQLDRIRAFELLDHYRLSRSAPTEVPSASGLLQSREEREQAILSRTGRQVEETLLRIPGVLEARVHLSALPSAGAFSPRAGAYSVRAGVFVVAQDGAPIEESGLRGLLAGAIGIDGGQVGLILVREAEPEQSPSIDRLGSRLQSADTIPSLSRVSRNHRRIVGMALTVIIGGALAAIRRRRSREFGEPGARQLTPRPPRRATVREGALPPGERHASSSLSHPV